MKYRASIPILLTLLGIFTIVVVLPTVGFGEVPQQINYQGRLTDAEGGLLDSDYVMSFSIYNVPVGGTALWGEGQIVAVDAGIYNVQIGQDPMGNPFPSNLFDGQRLLGVAVGADAEMTPRQKLTSTPFAMRATLADGAATGGITETMLADEAVTADKVATGAITAEKISGGTGSGVDADLIDGLEAASFATSRHNNHNTLYYTQSEVNALVNRIAALEAKLQYLIVETEAINGLSGPHVIFNGANFHVNSGSGSTDAEINGLGNIIVGYNEERSFATSNKSGSHNLIVGSEHNFTSFGGFVSGWGNTISGPHSSVSGGGANTASGEYASVSGGGENLSSSLNRVPDDMMFQSRCGRVT